MTMYCEDSAFLRKSVELLTLPDSYFLKHVAIVIILFQSNSEAGSYQKVTESPRVPLNSVQQLNMGSKHTIEEDSISDHSELNFSHYSPSVKARSYPKLNTAARQHSRRSQNSLRKF